MTVSLAGSAEGKTEEDEYWAKGQGSLRGERVLPGFLLALGVFGRITLAKQGVLPFGCHSPHSILQDKVRSLQLPLPPVPLGGSS